MGAEHLPCTAPGAQGLDIGPDSVREFTGALQGARTVLWNGPMGVFEFGRFAAGTLAVARAIADLTPQVANLVCINLSHAPGCPTNPRCTGRCSVSSVSH